MSGFVALAPGPAGELVAELRRVAGDLDDAAGEARCLLGRVVRVSAAPGLLEDVAAWAARVAVELDARIERLVRSEAALSVSPAVGGRGVRIDAAGARDVDDLLDGLARAGVLAWCPRAGSPAARRAALATLPAGVVGHLVSRAPAVVGRADGVAFGVRDAANRVLLTHELERLRGAGHGGRAGLARDLAGWHDDRGLALVGLDIAAGRAVLARGDLDAASHVTVLVPGAGQSLGTLADRHVGWMDRLHAGVSDRLAGEGRAATVLWLDYAPPARAIPDAAHAGAADDGARRLASFLDGLATVDRELVTTVGHSYGSVVLGRSLAARPGTLATDQAVALGSPGLGVQWSTSLGLRDDQRLLAGTFAQDPIALVGRGDPPGLALLGRAVHGPDPRRLRAAERLALPSHDLPAATPAQRHMHYLRAGSTALDRLTTLAAGRHPTRRR